MAKENLPTVAEIIDDLLHGLNDLKNHDINGDGKVTIDDVTALIDKILKGDGNDEPFDGTIDVNGYQFRMIKVNGGTFTMGSPETESGRGTNEDQHQVTLTKDYWIGETQVTNALWKAVMGNIPSKHKAEGHPVEMVSWEDCQAFIVKLNKITGKTFRLPTEAEWEFAARGGTLSKGLPFPGCDIPKNGGEPKKYIWYVSNSDSTTQPVSQKLPNELGLYDMGGNVNEWVEDWYGQYPKEAQTDPQGAASGSFRIYRGGAYTDAVKCCRNAYRYPAKPSYKQPFIGFRIVLSV